MNYEKIYNDIIEKSKNRVLVCYSENHHIIPKCMGGDNSKKNLGRLTPKEHFICHKLLCEIYNDNNKLKVAMFLMSAPKNKHTNVYYRVSSREYARLREAFSKIISKMKKGIKLSLVHKNKISKANKGKPRPGSGPKKGQHNNKNGYKLSDETKKKMSNSKKGKPTPMLGMDPWNKGLKGVQSFPDRVVSQETKDKIRETRKEKNIPSPNKGNKMSDEQKSKLSIKKKGKTWEEIYGIEGAELLRKNRTENALKRKIIKNK